MHGKLKILAPAFLLAALISCGGGGGTGVTTSGVGLAEFIEQVTGAAASAAVASGM